MARHPQGTPGKTSKPAPRKVNVTPANLPAQSKGQALPAQASAKAKKAVAKPKGKR